MIDKPTLFVCPGGVPGAQGKFRLRTLQAQILL